MVDQRFHGEAMRRKTAQFRAEFSGGTVIWIDKQIGPGPDEISASWLRSQLPTDDSPVVLKFHSEGGSCFEANAMVDQLNEYGGKVTGVVQSMALSAASMVLTACDEVEMHPNAFIMLHEPHMDEGSGAHQSLLDSLAEGMAEAYAKRSRQSVGTIRRMMAAETFLDATEAVRLGFADRIVEPSQPRLARAPAVLAKRKRKSQTATARWATAVLASGSVTLANRNNPGLRQKMLREFNSR